MKDYFGYREKVCVVTGAASGMGKATVEMLVDLGAKVYALDITSIRVPGIEKAIYVNLAEKKSIDDAFQQVPDTIDRYFGIAGVSGLHHSFAETFTINYVANKYITEEYLDKRLPDGGGIVFCTSSGGLGWEKPACRSEYMGVIDTKGWDATVAAVEKLANEHLDTPGPIYYGLSKRAMNYYVAANVEKFATRKIRLNAVLPMGTDTGLKADFATMAGDIESMIEYGTGLAHRLAEPSEMAAPMVFLNSDMASFLDGVLMSADYGMKVRIDAGIDADMFSNPHFGAVAEPHAASAVSEKQPKKRISLAQLFRPKDKAEEKRDTSGLTLTIDSKLKDLMADPRSVTVVEKYIPGISTNKQTKMAYGLSLRALCKYPQVGISPAKVDELARELENLGI